MKTLTLLLSTLLVAGASAEPPCCKVVAPAAGYTDKSLYQLDSSWTSDVGKQVKLEVLRGRPQVITMFFARCEYTCPMIVQHMRDLERALPDSLQGKVDFLLVSFDTDRDTPEALRAFRERLKLPTESWTLLRGGADDVRELAALLGINFAKDARGQYSHSNVIIVLNADGEIAFQHTGVASGRAELLTALKRLDSNSKLSYSQPETNPQKQ